MWRPIGSAPKNGEQVLVGAILPWHGVRMSFAYWHAAMGTWWDGSRLRYKPTHWWDFGDGATMPPPPDDTINKETSQ